MKNILKIATASVLASAALMAIAPCAMAHDRINWSISVGVPYYPAPVYSQPPVVYMEPAPVYVQPQPIYVQPRPVYMERTPVVEYRTYSPQPYYGDEVRHRERHEYWKHHHYYNHD